MIARDLWHDLIAYVPLVDLRDLSRASPLFDKVICSIGRRVFYGNKYIVQLNDKHTVIVMHSGKKYVLLRDNFPFIFKIIGIDGSILGTYITYASKSYRHDIIYYDPTKDIAIFRGVHRTWIKKNCGPLNKYNFIVDFVNTITGGPNAVDLTNCIAMNHLLPTDNAGRIIEVEHFKILFKDNKWTQ